MEETRRWLCEHAAKLFDQDVSDSVTELGKAQQVVSNQLQQETLPCGFSSCTRVFKYAESIMRSPNMVWYQMMLYSHLPVLKLPRRNQMKSYLPHRLLHLNQMSPGFIQNPFQLHRFTEVWHKERGSHF